MVERKCDGCTKCCEGWLTGEVNGYSFFKGRPCFYLNKTCTIYESRPEHPCRVYECEWLSDSVFPMWMKPDISNIIITKRTHEYIDFYEIIEAGGIISAKTLNWLIQWALDHKINLLYFVEGGLNRIGSKEFLEINFSNS